MNSENSEPASDFENPVLQFAFEIDLDFRRAHHLPDTPAGFTRSAVYVDGGRVAGPRLNGKVVPDSGGDWAQIRPDGTLSFDARYMLEADDGTLILLRNSGYLWGRKPDTIDRIRQWIFNDGPPVADSEYYLRSSPSFEVQAGKHDWLTRHVIVGVGKRKQHGNVVRYYVVL